MRLDKSTYRSIVEMLAARRPGIDEVEAVYSVASPQHDEPVGRGAGSVAAAGVAVRDRMGVGAGTAASVGGGWGRPGRGRGEDGRGRGGRGRGDAHQHQQSPDTITRDAALRLLSYLSATGGDADYTTAEPGGKPVDSLDVMIASSSIRFTMHVPTTSGGLSRPAVPDADSIAIRKERVRPAVGVAEYRLRFNMKSEVSIPIAEALQASSMASHAGTSRTYRLKKRYSFFPKSVDGKNAAAVRIDLTAVRQLSSTATTTPTFAQVARAPERYEVEVECIERVGKDALPPDELAREMLSHFSVVLKVLDDTDEVMSVSECKAVLAEYGDLVQQHGRFVGPKPVTLERKHLFGAQCVSALPTRAGIPCATHDYTVTDKADGERRMMFVSADKRVYTINDRLVVRDTGLSSRRLVRCLLDGETEARPRVAGRLRRTGEATKTQRRGTPAGSTSHGAWSTTSSWISRARSPSRSFGARGAIARSRRRAATCCSAATRAGRATTSTG